MLWQALKIVWLLSLFRPLSSNELRLVRSASFVPPFSYSFYLKEKRHLRTLKFWVKHRKKIYDKNIWKSRYVYLVRATWYGLYQGCNNWYWFLRWIQASKTRLQLYHSTCKVFTFAAGFKHVYIQECIHTKYSQIICEI